MKCRFCHSESKKFLSLGSSPHANSFLKAEDLAKEEKTYPLELYLCNQCKLVQLGCIIPKEDMFTNYVYVSSTTKTFVKHFTEMAHNLVEKLKLDSSSLVVDIGSNDGLLLKGFKEKHVKVMGVEPAVKIAAMANDAGIETINAFFDEEVVRKIVDTKGKADLITCNNAFAHIEDIPLVTENIKKLMKDDGSLVIEIQYFFDTLETMTFDNVYHEHMYYYTLTSLNNFFKSKEMVVYDVQRVDTHGGSLRVFVQKKEGPHPVSNNVTSMLKEEAQKGVSDELVYQKFAHKVLKTKEIVLSYVKKINAEGKKLVGYGAPAKSTTLLNFCGLTNKDITYIVEDNPLKIGLYTPGTHIPLEPSKTLEEDAPDYVLILAWNFAPEILEKTKNLAEKGVKFIIPLPEPRIVGDN